MTLIRIVSVRTSRLDHHNSINLQRKGYVYLDSSLQSMGSKCEGGGFEYHDKYSVLKPRIHAGACGGLINTAQPVGNLRNPFPARFK